VYIPLPVARCQVGSCLPCIDFLFGQNASHSHIAHFPEAIPCLHLIILLGLAGICHANGSAAKAHNHISFKVVRSLKNGQCPSSLNMACPGSFILIVNCIRPWALFYFSHSHSPRESSGIGNRA